MLQMHNQSFKTPLQHAACKIISVILPHLQNSNYWKRVCSAWNRKYRNC